MTSTDDLDPYLTVTTADGFVYTGDRELFDPPSEFHDLQFLLRRGLDLISRFQFS